MSGRSRDDARISSTRLAAWYGPSVTKRRKERERKRRLAHAEVVPREEREPRPERAPAKNAGGKSPCQAASRCPRRRCSARSSAQRSSFVVLTALIYVVDTGKHSIGADALQASLGAIFFVPFDYLLTRIMYRRLGNRTGS